MPPAPTDPAAEALQLASTDIPEALDELGRKHDYVNDVVQWCESSYQSGDKNLVLKQTKEYLVDALEVVAKDVETTSAKLIRFLSLQNDAVEGLGLELDAVRERAHIINDEVTNQLTERLNKNMYALSVIAAIFLPLGFLTGLLGINIAGIPGAENPAAFAIFCAMLGMLVIAQILLFRKLKWF